MPIRFLDDVPSDSGAKEGLGKIRFVDEEGTSETQRPLNPQRVPGWQRALFPLSSSITEGEKPSLGRTVKANLGAGLDIVSAPFRGLDALVNEGSKITNPLVNKALGSKLVPWDEAKEAVRDKIPGGDNIVSNNLRTGVDMALSPSSYFGGLGVKQLATTPERLAAQKLEKQMAIDLTPKKPLIEQLRSEEGAIRLPGGKDSEIPDIDELANAADESSKEILTPKQVKQMVGEAPRRGVLSRVPDDAATLLSEPIGEKDTPFTDYAVQARKAKQNMREMTPLDMAGAKGVQALKEVSKIKSDIGKKMEEALKPIQQEHYTKGTLLSSQPIKQRWGEAVEKYLGAKFDDSGNIVAAEGREITDPAESALFKQLNSKIKGLSNGITIKELADTKTAVRRLVENHKASMAKPINTTAEAAGKDVNGLIDQIIMGYAGPEYEALSRNYNNVQKIESQLSRRLGEITDKDKGTARMGASLMKSAVQSNSDRGSKALFDAVRKVTGIDLIKDAGYAETAMKAIGDSRVNDLLQDVGGIKQAVAAPGAAGKILKGAEIAYDKLRGDRLDELIKYYNSVHNKAANSSAKKLGQKVLGE